MAAVSRTTCFLVVWTIFLTAHMSICCMEGDGYFGWQCDNVTGCFCKQGQRCQQTLGTCPEHCVDNPWGIGCQDEYINLAHGKPATQSSTYSEGGVRYPADLAVDGDNSTDNLKCTRTNYSDDPTWSVDLEGLYVVRSVVLIKPTRFADICQFQGVWLCINNNTVQETGCRDSVQIKTWVLNAETAVTVEIAMNSVTPCMESVHLAVLKDGRDIMGHVKSGMNQDIHRCDGFAKLTVRYEGEFNSGTTDVLQVKETQLITITNLTTYSKYTIYLTAVNNLYLQGPPVIVMHTTAEGIPSKMAAPEVTSTGDSFIEITWRAPSPPGGVIVSYEISYTQQSSLWNDTVTTADSSSMYIVDLQFNSTYVIRIRAKTAVGYGEYSDAIQATTDTEKASSVPATGINGGAVAGGVLGVLVLVVVFVVVVLIYKRRRRPQELDQVEAFSELQRKEDLDDHVYESPVQVMYENTEDEHLYSSIKQNTEISVENIYEVMKLKARYILHGEYQKFPLTLKYPCEVGQKRENKLKNRFRNTIPYDHNRVVLDLLPDDPNSDYINANYIDGYNRPRAFIAAQGPKSNTVNDFWRMVWQVKSPQIVMLTKTVEMGKQKCEQYWADEGMKQFGEIQVTTLDEVQGQDFFVRNLQYCKVGHPTVHTVKQFHFTGWPDNGVPIDPTALVKFREEVEKHDILVEGQGPVVVHCSDGVGNTGTFIALDYLFEQALAEGKVDVFRLVQSLRASRPKMVQTKEQYYFIHDTLLEELHCGITFIRLQDLASRLRKLRQRNKTGLTKMEEEFAVLGLMLPEIEESSTKTALEPINIGKNRVTNIVAGNHCRPRLTSYAEDSTDYINAVFIDGYQRQNSYIITQMPLPHTIVDFWSMLYDQQCATIVMLNELNDDSKTSGVYWPTEKMTSYGPFNVEMTSTRQSGKRITVRELRVTNSKDVSTISIIM
ncbi:receptor-type tyrosine-protein phosphatase epsilon-like [Lingula anatina]|uniref:protein-tyrosine-phosphatase n=1 Tax=Lingula anatina TaxID=7574 RepID=A0A2R2MRG5_LINAN|nr:receptor-type tyrosine-protein phosphatase epsilon-like [Lingula anatina]|eukprot:XP_023932844.1 receptor-type tyrosine-protein phosphatase epsilon-like [Lingula anatina]